MERHQLRQKSFCDKNWFLVAKNGFSFDGHLSRLSGFQGDFDPTGSSRLFQIVFATKNIFLNFSRWRFRNILLYKLKKWRVIQNSALSVKLLYKLIWFILILKVIKTYKFQIYLQVYFISSDMFNMWLEIYISLKYCINRTKRWLGRGSL